MGKTRSNSPLPPDLIKEILHLLPLQSLLACKLVSKEWKNLIEDYTFFKRYRDESSSILLRDGAPCCVFRNDRTNTFTVRRIPINLPIYGNHLLLESPTNKLVCIKAYGGGFHSYNPLMGYSFVVATVPYERYYYVGLGYGFGYDRRNDDHKLLVVSSADLRLHRTLTAGNSTLFVYSFGARRWDKCRGFPYVGYDWLVQREWGYSLDGVVHWVVAKRGGAEFSRKQLVVGVDLHGYEFKEIELPMVYSDVLLPYGILCELDGKLCCWADSAYSFELWVMEVYGVAESWRKLLSIHKLEIGLPNFWGMSSLSVYRCGDGGKKVVVVVDHELKLELFGYDLEKGEMQVFKKNRRENWIRRLFRRIFKNPTPLKC